MRSATRSSDTIARMGGDEFIGVCGRIAAASDAEIVASKLVEKLDAPFVLSGEPTRIGVSIGISIYPEHAEDSETLLANADRAMYAVKASGRGGYRIYQPEDADRSPE